MNNLNSETFKTENEARKQLVGVKITVILSIAVYFITWIYGLWVAVDEAYSNVVSGLYFFTVYTVFFVGFLVLSIIGLVGLIRRKSYSIPVNRAVLIIFAIPIYSFFIGLILLFVFWPRLKKPIVKEYLNYGKKSLEETYSDNKTGASLIVLKIIGSILFYGMGIVLLVYSVIFYYTLWGFWGVIGTLVLFPLVEIFPIVAWIVTGSFPGLIFALWGVGIVGGILMGIGSRD